MKSVAAFAALIVGAALFILFVGQIAADNRITRLEQSFPCVGCPCRQPPAPFAPKRRTGDMGDLPPGGVLLPLEKPIWRDQGPIGP